MDVKKFVALFVALLLVAILYGVLGNQTGTTSESDDLRNVEYSSWNDTILANVNSPQTLTQTPTSGFSATVKNQTWLEFDGVDDWVNESSTLITGLDFTLIVWLNISDNDGIDNIIGQYNHLSGTAKTDYDWGFYTNADNFVTIIANDSGTGVSYNIPSLSSYVGVFRQYAMAVTENNIETFIDAVSKNSRNTIRGVHSQGHDFKIGYSSNGARLFNGSSDEVILFDRLLEDEEIELFYNESRYGSDWGKRVPELTYHYLNNTQDTFNINSSNFRDHMDYLNDSGFETVTYKQYKSWVDGTFAMPDKPVIIVVDDGRLSTLDFKDIMDDYGFVGVASIPSGDINSAGVMNWSNVTQLIDAGWEIASHTVTQPDMKTKTVTQRADEFQNSKSSIEGNVSFTVTSFVFPLNSQNSTLRTECLSFGYTVCTGDSQQSTTLKKYNYKSIDMINDGTQRISIRNRTNFDLHFYNYSWLVNPEDSSVLKWKLNENSASTAYDVSGNSNNGTITGATWNNDGINNTITLDTDYNRTGTTFTIINSEYSWSEILTSYTYQSLKETFGFHVAIMRILTGFVGLAVLTFAVMVMFIIFREVGLL